MLRTSNTATIPKYVGIPPRKAEKSNCPVKITAHKATKATRATALWNALDHGTEITQIPQTTRPLPERRYRAKDAPHPDATSYGIREITSALYYLLLECNSCPI